MIDQGSNDSNAAEHGLAELWDLWELWNRYPGQALQWMRAYRARPSKEMERLRREWLADPVAQEEYKRWLDSNLHF